MYKLYLDTSTFFLCIGLEKDNDFIYKFQTLAEKKQSEMTMPELNKALSYNNIKLADIEEVIVSIGPGSYTGIRIGLCIAKVIASLKNIPLKVVSSLNAFANNQKQIVLVDAKGDRSYIGIYDNHQPLIEDQVLDNKTINTLIKDYPDFKIVNVDALKNSFSIDILENMKAISLTTKPVKDVDSVIPTYLKDR